jgi:hypothetical protein
VARLDLTGLSASDAAAGVDTAVEAALTGGAGGRPTELAGVLAVDTESGLTRHRAAYERVLVGGNRVPLLCLVMDDPMDEAARPREQHSWGGRAAGPVLARPALLRPPLAGILWVRDVRGASAGAGSWSPPDPDADREALEALVDLLRVPEVFGRVQEALRDMPEAVAGPSLRVLLYDLAEDTLRQAQAAALRRFAGTTEDAGRLRSGTPPPGSLALLAGARRGAEGGQWRRRGGLAQRLHDDTAAAVDAAAGLRDRVRRYRGLFDPAGSRLPDALADAASAMEAYRSTVAGALTDPRIGPGGPQERQAALDGLGVDLVPDPEVSRARMHTDLREHTHTLLAQHRPLREISAALADLSRRTAPAGSTGHRLADLDAACPPDLHDRLTARHPFRSSTGTPVTALGIGVAGLLAALPLGPAAGIPAGVLITLLAYGSLLLVGLRRPDRSGEVEHRGLLTLLAGAAGTAVGAALAGVVPDSPAAAVAGPVLGLLLVGWTTAWTWTAAVDDWSTETGLDAAAGVADRIERVLGDAVANDWQLAGPRTEVSRAAFTIASAVREMADAVDGIAAGLAPARNGRRSLSQVSPPRADVPWLERGIGEGGPALEETLVGDFCDTTAGVLQPCWPALLSASERARELRAGDRARDGIEATLQFARQYGVGVPPFPREGVRRPGPEALLGISTDQVADALSDLDDPVGPLPLCDADQLRVLVRTPADSREIRFAPVSTRSRVLGARGLTADLPEFSGGPGWRESVEDAVWMESGRYAGVLRLSPFAVGAVRTFQTLQDEDPDGPDRAAS